MKSKMTTLAVAGAIALLMAVIALACGNGEEPGWIRQESGDTETTADSELMSIQAPAAAARPARRAVPGRWPRLPPRQRSRRLSSRGKSLRKSSLQLPPGLRLPD